jgi:outer membrane protein OmpA-like peptidoglycan-associated protein
MRRFSRIGQCGAAARGALLCALILALGAGEGRAAAQALLAPTPLILKDGRIASVAVHVLSFRQGAEALDAQASAELRALTREAATDCFLTAQVIGHVGLAEISANDTLAAHRLARSRADSVQAALIGGGLPVNAIASVWDWQFMVREPRATIWLFRLTEGEDCEGTPLEPGAPALVAGADPDPAGTGTPGRDARADAGQATAERGVQAAAPATRPQRAADAALTSEDRAAGEAAPPPAERGTPPSEKATAAAAPASEKDAGKRAARPRQEVAPAPESRERAVVTARPKSEPAPSARPAGSLPAEGGRGAAPGKAGRAEATATARAGTDGPKPTATDGSTRRAESEAAPQAPDGAPAARGQARLEGSSAGMPAGQGPSGVPTVIQALPALSPTPPAESSSAAAPAARPSRGSVAAAEAAEAPIAEKSGKPALVITFANNSSYFPPATARDLQALARELEPGRRYRVHLLSAVGGSDQVVGASTAAEAERYNRWLAERRAERVQEWLAENVSGPELDIKTAFTQEDNSRQVTIRIGPAG